MRWISPAMRFDEAMRHLAEEARHCFADAASVDQRFDPAIELGELVRRYRGELRLSLDDVARLAGSTKSHIWEIEDGRSSNPTVRMVQGLAVALGIPSGVVFQAALVTASKGK